MKSTAIGKTIRETTIAVKSLALDLGFDGVGITDAKPFTEHQKVALSRIQSGLMDGLTWYTKERVTRGCNPSEVLPGARSIIGVSLKYYALGSNGNTNKTRGRIARYAWGNDYHKIMEKRLKLFVKELSKLLDKSFQAKVYVDTGPILERAVAERAGIGWFGKNTNILTADHGSWVFLGQVITDLVLLPDTPLKKTCGACKICIDECPTQAIIAPYVLDNRKCISFLTIESRGSIPKELRELIGDWVFGCDICQDVCPVNRGVEPTREVAFQTGKHGFESLDLVPLLEITEGEFQAKFKNSPIKRAKRVGLIRNVCIALGNIGDQKAVPYLGKSVLHQEPLIREHSAWALSRIGGKEAEQHLKKAYLSEQDPGIKSEIESYILNLS